MIREGIVVDTNDPQQMGRFKALVPSIDGDIYDIDSLPWVRYNSIFAGQVKDYPSGPNANVTSGLKSYGWWGIPKAGSIVAIGFLYDDINQRIYLGNLFGDHGNRSLPTGRNHPEISKGGVSDTLQPMQPQATNLGIQFRNQLDAPEALTRGAFERAVAQDKTDKDGTDGYQEDLITPKDKDGNPIYDPQTFSLTTPGGHALIFHDNPENCRVRVKTAAGHQIILDDANERIYISTAQGRTWLELDQDGRIHCYAEGGVALSSGGELNITAVGDLNLSGANVNIQASGALRLAGCQAASLSGAGLNLESSANFNILASGQILATGSTIHLNGPTAGSAECPDGNTTIPTHEPWTREDSKLARGKNWKK